MVILSANHLLTEQIFPPPNIAPSFETIATAIITNAPVLLISLYCPDQTLDPLDLPRLIEYLSKQPIPVPDGDFIAKDQLWYKTLVLMAYLSGTSRTLLLYK